RYDAIRLGVDATDPAVGSVVQLPFTNLRVTFNEPYDPATVGISNLTLTQGRVTAATPVDKVTVDYTLTGINTEGTLTARMAAGALTDVFGNPSVPFEGTYSTDIGDVPFPTPLRSVRPSNSLIYQEVATGILNSAKDEDTFHLLIDPAQTISVIVNPAAAVQPAVDLYA